MKDGQSHVEFTIEEYEKMERRTTDQDVVDLKGWTIPKGTPIIIIKEFDLIHFRTHEKEHFVKCLIDNGTIYDNGKQAYDLMPQTVFKIGTGEFA